MTDSFDRMIVASRQRLRSAAEEAVDSDATLRQIIDGHARVQRWTGGGSGDPRGRWMLAIAATLVIVVGGLVAVQRRNDSATTTIPTSPPSSVAPTLSTVAATALVSTTEPALSSSSAAPTTITADLPTLSRTVQDVTFVDAQHGWALVGVDSKVLYVTVDGGTTWSPEPVDASDARHVTFADVSNGWLLAEDGRFQSTHDGGVSWHEVDLAGAGMRQGAEALTTDGSTVTIIAGIDAADQNVNWTVASSPVGRDDFTRAGVQFQQGAGPANEFELASSVGRTWAVYNDRLVVGAARGSGGVWTDWTPSWSDLGGAAGLAVAPDGGAMFALVNAGEWTSGVVEYQLYRSDDNGDSFRQMPLPPALPTTTGPQQIIAVDAGTLVVTMALTDGSTVVYRSDDGAVTWTPLSTFDDQGTVQVSFVDRTTVLAVQAVSDGSTSRVVKSVDGGVTWLPIVIVPPS